MTTGGVMATKLSCQLDVLKPQLVSVLKLLFQLLDILARLYSRRACNGAPYCAQAGLFAVGGVGFKHGGRCIDVSL
jgi:hypothetical protein